MEYVVDVEPEATSTHFLPTNHQSEGRQKYREQYQPLYIAILKNDWNSAEKVINQYPSVLSDYISEGNETALHIAALSKDFSFVKKLVAKLSRQDMEIQNGQGNTALCFAAVDGNIRIAKLMIEKNDKLPNIYGPNGVKPIEMAASLGQKEMVEYLYPLSQVKNWSTQEQATLLTTCISSGLYDAAFRMVQDDSTLIAARDGNGETALHVLAHLPLSSDGECGLHNGLWRRIINSCQFILALCMAFHCGVRGLTL